MLAIFSTPENTETRRRKQWHTGSLVTGQNVKKSKFTKTSTHVKCSVLVETKVHPTGTSWRVFRLWSIRRGDQPGVPAGFSFLWDFHGFPPKIHMGVAWKGLPGLPQELNGKNECFWKIVNGWYGWWRWMTVVPFQETHHWISATYQSSCIVQSRRLRGGLPSTVPHREEQGALAYGIGISIINKQNITSKWTTNVHGEKGVKMFWRCLQTSETTTS